MHNLGKLKGERIDLGMNRGRVLDGTVTVGYSTLYVSIHPRMAETLVNRLCQYANDLNEVIVIVQRESNYKRCCTHLS